MTKSKRKTIIQKQERHLKCCRWKTKTEKREKNVGDLNRKIFCLEPGPRAAAGSLIVFAVGGPITRGLDRCGYCLVPGGTRLS